MRKDQVSSQESSSRSTPERNVRGDRDRGSKIPDLMGFVGEEIRDSIGAEEMGEKNSIKVDYISSVSNIVIIEDGATIKSYEKYATDTEFRLEVENGLKRGDENGGKNRDETDFNMAFDGSDRSTESAVEGNISYGQDGSNIVIGVRSNEMKNKDDNAEEESRGRERAARSSEKEVEVEVGDDTYMAATGGTLKIPLPVDIVSGIIR